MTACKADNDPTAKEFIRDLRQQVVGQGELIDTPFGAKPLLYCDHTASGRSLHSIEQLIAREVLPHYANTHSEASHTGRRTGQFREWARQRIKDVINAVRPSSMPLNSQTSPEVTNPKTLTKAKKVPNMDFALKVYRDFLKNLLLSSNGLRKAILRIPLIIAICKLNFDNVNG